MPHVQNKNKQDNQQLLTTKTHVYIVPHCVAKK